MKYDLDVNGLNKEIDGLLDNELLEISDEEEATFDTTNLDSEIVITVDYVDNGVDELAKSQIDLEMLNKNDSKSIKDMENGETVLSKTELEYMVTNGEKVLTTFDTCSNVTLV